MSQLPTDARHSSSILRRCFAEALDRQAFRIVNSRLTDEILRHCYMIDQAGSTSSTHVSRTLLSEPAAWTAVMVDRTANLELAAKEIIAAKSFGASQSPYAPNCILVNEFVEAEFTRLLLKHLPGTASSHTNGSAYTSNHNDGITQSKATKYAKASNVVLTTSSYKIIKVAQRQVLHIRCGNECLTSIGLRSTHLRKRIPTHCQCWL
jgi:acyl-CoA reductase-like NAD-dependent aldehyde dehydrogenase